MNDRLMWSREQVELALKSTDYKFVERTRDCCQQHRDDLKHFFGKRWPALWQSFDADVARLDAYLKGPYFYALAS